MLLLNLIQAFYKKKFWLKLEGVCQGAEQKPKSVLQEKIEKGRYGGRYGMFRFNVLGSEVKLYFTLFCRYAVLFCFIS